ncbi:tyrosyl-tRNA synthetase [Mycoplasma testudineum]|uniref:Tyrosine--tRNA ligase n=1 Tax=Mycoplasma testudineum TaxID=244584 RepID=A0A4R6IH81_9MOLU|nr:tyrosine--tRNA ligase [Mycoplasma testudineum]OYD27102.1 tyrosine--tRNA ligase [Mycoplasma testudineum]TDO21147.1 tyrosyl-tRNA synthetase [Mycoplasma testudineum]
MKNFKQVIEDFQKRNIVHTISNVEKLEKITNKEGIYIGFDPTATSLHLGNYTQIVNLIRLQRNGFKVFGILGGATGMIGDPSFKNSERKLLENNELELNKSKIKKQLESFNLKVIDNLDFYKDLNVIEFLRFVGKEFNVATMLSKDSVANRIQFGLSYTEFSYTLLQAYDFYQLAQKYNVAVQLGGSDQWGNLVSGLDLISRKINADFPSLAITTNLIVDENGNKFSKTTGGGSLWLDPTLTTPYQLYQFLLNQPDSMIETLVKQLVLKELDEIEVVLQKHKQDTSLKIGQKYLAYQVVSDIHGKESVDQAEKISSILFGNGLASNLNESDLEILSKNLDVFNFSSDIITTLLNSKIVQSKRELREFIANGSLEINGEKFLSEEQTINNNLYGDNYILIKKGKRNFYIVTTKNHNGN